MTTVPMVIEEVTCCVLINGALARDDFFQTEKSTECPDTTIETRLLWAREIAKEFQSCSNGDSIRPWMFICNSDGTVERLAVQAPKGGHDKAYPVRFRIPPSTILGLGEEERNKRSEMFALGTLLYEVNSGNKLFEGLSDDEVQLRFSNGKFPEDVESLQLSPAILSCWSLGVLNETDAEPIYNRIVRGAGGYIRQHPMSFAVQTVGVLALTASVTALPLLWAAGFTSAGPAAGSLAAVWQSSIGSVAAGSAFAWCQSAAMGGAAASGIFGFGAAGAGAIGVGTLPILAGKFRGVFRRRET